MTEIRDTKYNRAIREAIGKLGHATNSRLLTELRNDFPELSATTVHRATARLHDRKEIAEAPADSHGSMRFDANTDPHDHFVCSGCECIRDLDISAELLPIISKSLDNCRISGRLVINGKCENCLKKEK